MTSENLSLCCTDFTEILLPSKLTKKKSYNGERKQPCHQTKVNLFNFYLEAESVQWSTFTSHIFGCSELYNTKRDTDMQKLSATREKVALNLFILLGTLKIRFNT